MALTDLRAAAQHAIARAALWAVKRGYAAPAALTGPLTLDTTYPMIVGLDPGGAARVVTLDGSDAAAGDSSIAGLLRVIVNRAGAAEALTVNDAAGPTLIGTVGQNQAGIFYHDPDTGWVLVCLLTIALS